MLENNKKIYVYKKTTKNYKIAIAKMPKDQHGYAEIQSFTHSSVNINSGHNERIAFYLSFDWC